jgi:hypothetical protein
LTQGDVNSTVPASDLSFESLPPSHVNAVANTDFHFTFDDLTVSTRVRLKAKLGFADQNRHQLRKKMFKNGKILSILIVWLSIRFAIKAENPLYAIRR